MNSDCLCFCGPSIDTKTARANVAHCPKKSLSAGRCEGFRGNSLKRMILKKNNPSHPICLSLVLRFGSFSVCFGRRLWTPSRSPHTESGSPISNLSPSAGVSWHRSDLSDSLRRVYMKHFTSQNMLSACYRFGHAMVTIEQTSLTMIR